MGSGVPGVGGLPGDEPPGDSIGGEDTEEEHAEFEEEDKRPCEDEHRERIRGREDGSGDDAAEDDVLAVAVEPGGLDEAGPPEQENDDGRLEPEGEGDGEAEEHLDVLADAVVLDDPGMAGEGGSEDGTKARGILDADASLEEGGVDPFLAVGGIGGVVLEDRDRGEGDARGEGGGGDADTVGARPEADEEGEDDGEHDGVHEDGAEGGEEDAHGREEVDKAAFVAIEPRGDELPELEEDPGGADDDGAHEGDADIGPKGFERSGGLEGGGEFASAEFALDGNEEEVEERLPEPEGDEEDGDDADEGEDEPSAEVLEVIPEGHDGMLGVRVAHGMKP